MKLALTLSAAALAATALCAQSAPGYNPATDSLRFTGEVHLRNIKQLTFGGNNAEAYWSFDSKQLVFQSDWGEINTQGCDQIYVMNADGSPMADGKRYRQISTGKGRTTCSYFLKDGRIVFGSTHVADAACPHTQPFAGGRYVWPIHDTYDIFVADADGSNVKPLISGPGYDAEATASPDGKYLVYTSTKSGDLELWRYDLATGEHLQLTKDLGYDGGAFFSADSKKIVWRASRPQGEEAAKYKELLAQGYVEPKAMDLYIADLDGTNVRRITTLPGANWAPFFHPDGKSILFSSNHHTMNKGGRVFDIFRIDIASGAMTQLTHSGTFDAFPMFSFDGKKIVFASNRNLDRTPSRVTNVFVADWVEEPTEADRTFVSPVQPKADPAPKKHPHGHHGHDH